MRALVVRLDSFGDVLLAGPAVRAVAHRADRVAMLCGPQGAPAARLLPGVAEVLVWEAPWVGFSPPAVDRADVGRVVDRLAAGRFDAALVLTSFHQSPLPAALLLRMAGVAHIAADSVDAPGSLLDVRHRRPPRAHEAEAALALAEAAGFPRPPGDDGRLRVRHAAGAPELTGPGPYVAVHPGASVPARRWSPDRCAQAVRLLAGAGHRVVVTGGPGERGLTAHVAGAHGVDLGGRTRPPELAAVLAAAGAVVTGNTGPAHLAAAVGTPVVSLFSPVVPAERWGPYGVPHVLLGGQDAPCAGSRARECPVPGHPCLDGVTAEDVVAAVGKLLGAGGVRPRVLVLRALGLGDLLAAVPALRAVRRGFPGHEVVLAAPRALADAAAAVDAVDALLPASAPGRAVPVRLAWPGPPPEAAVDLHGKGPSSHLLLERTRPGRLLAFAHPGTPHVRGPVWRVDEHERKRWCRLLEWYGIPADPGDLRLPPPREPSPAPGAVVVHPGADAAARRWPPGRYARVVRELRRRGHRVVLTGGPGEDGLLARVAGPAGLGEGEVLAGGLPYGRLAALCAGAAAVVSGDTGVAHVAVAYGAPSVTLFGPVPPRLWGPPPDTRHVALWHPGPPGDPHGREPDPRLLRIEPDEVLAALLPHLEGARARPSSPPARPPS